MPSRRALARRFLQASIVNLGMSLGAASSGPEIQHSSKDYNRACQAESQRIADRMACNARTSLDSCYFGSSLGVIFGHEGSLPLMTNGVANDVFHVDAASFGWPQTTGCANDVPAV